jgi:hypothetical protein
MRPGSVCAQRSPPYVGEGMRRVVADRTAKREQKRVPCAIFHLPPAPWPSLQAKRLLVGMPL